MVYSQRNSVWQLRRNINLSVLFCDVIYDTLRKNMLEISMNIWIPHLKEHFNRQIQNVWLMVTEVTICSMALHHRIASETIGYHRRWQHQNLMIHLTFLPCLKCVMLLQTTHLHSRLLTCNSNGLCLLLINLCILLTRSAFMGTTHRICSCFPKSKVLVYALRVAYALRVTNIIIYAENKQKTNKQTGMETTDCQTDSSKRWATSCPGKEEGCKQKPQMPLMATQTAFPHLKVSWWYPLTECGNALWPNSSILGDQTTDMSLYAQNIQWNK